MKTTAPQASKLLPDNYRLLQDYIYKESGIVIDADKHYLLESRLLPVAERKNLKSLNDLCNLIRATGHMADVRREIVEAMTTHETLFYREPVQYDALRDVIIPDLLERRASTRTLSFWSAAASSGQEAYSLAMLLAEMNLPGWRFNILGTDLSEKILERARLGLYRQIEVERGLPPGLRPRYFQPDGANWKLNESIRRMVSFQTQDLRSALRNPGPFDVVFCRNVLIYFDQQTCRTILQRIRETMRSGSYLLFSAAENPPVAENEFERIAQGMAVYYRLR